MIGIKEKDRHHPTTIISDTVEADFGILAIASTIAIQNHMAIIMNLGVTTDLHTVSIGPDEMGTQVKPH